MNNWMDDRCQFIHIHCMWFCFYFLGGMISMNDGNLLGVEALPLVVEKSDAIKETYLTASLLGR